MQPFKTNFISLAKVIAIYILLFTFFTQNLYAANGINGTINFQGKVVNKTTGTNVTDGNYDFEFRLYDAASSGTLLWTEARTGANQVAVGDGIFRVALGSVTSLSSINFNSDSLYLEIDFNGETFTSERIRFAAVPYAFNAEKVNGLSVTNNGGNTLNIAANKTFTVSNTITLSGNDSASLNIGSGGTLGTGAYATISEYATLASPTFTGTVTIPTSFILGATTVTTSGTQLNYLAGATGTTGTTTTNLVFSTSPTLVTPTFNTGITLGTSATITLGASTGTTDECIKGGSGGATWGSCGAGSSLFTQGTGFAYLTSTTDDLVIGASSIAAASFYFDSSLGKLYLGKDNTGSGGLDGSLTLYSSGNGIADPSLTVDSSGNLTIQAPEDGASVVLGDSTGNIQLSVTNASDSIISDKTVTLAAAYSGNDFTINRILTSGDNAYNMSGSVLYVADTSTGLVGNTSTGDLIKGNVDLTTTAFTGNLLNLQMEGTSKFTVDYNGNANLSSVNISINAGSSGTTATLLVKLDTSGNVVTTNTTTLNEAIGVALDTKSSGQAVRVATQGIVSATADNTVTAGDYIGVGTTTAGRAKSLGTTYPSTSGVQVIGRALSSASAGSTFSLMLSGLDNNAGGGGAGEAQIIFFSNTEPVAF